MKAHLNTITSRTDCIDEVYLKAIAGQYPLNKLFKTEIKKPKQGVVCPGYKSLKNERSEIEIRPVFKTQQHHKIELDDQPLNESEKCELLEINTALTECNRDIEKLDSIEIILKKIEELIDSLKGQELYMQKECERRIKEYLMEILKILKTDTVIDAQILMRISELAKEYLEEKEQAQFLFVVLREYRKSQERSLNEQEVEKKTLETAEKFNNQCKMLNELLSLFPSRTNSQEKVMSKKTIIKSEVKPRQPKGKTVKAQFKNKQKILKETHELRNTNIPKKSPHRAQIKTSSKKQNTSKRINEDDEWIGNRNAELEDNTEWEKVPNT